MTADDFAEHVAAVRTRFANNLHSKIADSFASLAPMADGGEQATEAGIVTHRRLHEMYGVARTLGFTATGEAAGRAAGAINGAAKAKRPPKPDEIAALKTELERLRSAAAADLQTYSNGG